jgi:hypothetical protein
VALFAAFLMKDVSQHMTENVAVTLTNDDSEAVAKRKAVEA